MTTTNPDFQRALAITLEFEGGYVHDPDDPGGATHFGITQRTYDAWKKSLGQSPRAVRHITREEVAAIYQRDYWNTARCPDLPARIAIAHFDAAVHHGPRQAVRFLQRAVATTADGRFGPATAAAVARITDPDRVLAAMIDDRERFLRSIASRRPSQQKFLRGWLNRVRRLREALAGMPDAEAKPENATVPETSPSEEPAMTSPDWKSVLATVAPTLATALGGPLAGAAVSTIATALGIDSGKDDVAQAVLNARPDQLVALKNADYAFQVQMRELEVRVEEIAQIDRDSARQREMESGDVTQRWLAGGVTIGFFATLFAFMTLSGEMTTSAREALAILLGSLGTAWVQVMSYYFGSSNGSAVKTRQLEGIVRQRTVH